VDLDGDGSIDASSKGGTDIFLLKLDQQGKLVWIRTVGGKGAERAYRVELGADETIHWTGSFGADVDFDNDGVADLRSHGDLDISVAKHTRDGDLIWVHGAGGTKLDYSQDLALDSAGAVYIAGDFQAEADFNDDGKPDVTGEGGREALIAKWSAQGEWLWTRAARGPGNDRAVGVAVDHEGRAYLTGFFQGEADFSPGVRVRAGAPGFDSGYDAEMDRNGFIYVTGAVLGAKQYSGHDMFLAAYEPDGQLVWVQTLSEEPLLRSQDAGKNELYVAKYRRDGHRQWLRIGGGPGDDFLRRLALD